jgi:basic amino acid/polyamine antiporter, APA family
MIAGCGALIGLMSTVFVCLLEQPRIFYGMAKDGLLFKAFAYINQVTKVPQFSTIFSGIIFNYSF